MQNVSKKLDEYKDLLTHCEKESKQRRLGEALARASENVFLIHPLHDTVSSSCSCGRLDCHWPGKHPRLVGYQSCATADFKVIKKHWRRYRPANIGGIIPSWLVIVDWDPRNAGGQSLSGILSELGEIPATVTVATAGGGQHFLLRLPHGLVARKRDLAPGLELLTAGNNVVLPGSVVNGKRYEYSPGKSASEVAIAEAPAWLLDVIESQNTAKIHAKSAHTHTRTTALRVPLTTPQGTRHKQLPSVAGSLINKGIRGEELAEQLVQIDATHCVPPVGEEEARRIAESMEHTHNGKVQDDTNLSKHRQALLEILAAALDTEWRGRQGNSEFATLLGALAIAYDAGHITVQESHRQIAEAACLHLETVFKRMPGLIQKGWIKVHVTYWEQRKTLEQRKAEPEADLKAIGRVSHLLT